MGRTITCDLCHGEEAEIMYSTMADGVTIAVGPLCTPLFVTGLAIALGILPDPDATAEARDGGKPKRSRRGSAPTPETDAQPAESDAGALADAG